ncbi:MAG TPA: outer membrane beta-barrel protein, partial [Gemmatimonadales bacterium]|nr:outer membrane beta-barrel protein [Gemmatimonadales bacterium]
MRRILFSTLALGIGLAYPAPPAGAQDLREYRFELGVAGTYTSYDDATDLGGAAGGLLRVGYWLPYNFSIEAEGGLARPRTESADVSVSVRSLWGAVLYNLPIGALSRLHFKAGYGVVTYGEGSCPAVSLPGSGPCGSAATAVGGIGARIGVTPTLFIRSEATVTRTLSIRFSNVNFNLGVSLMLGSRTIGDADRDGVDDRADACP